MLCKSTLAYFDFGIFLYLLTLGFYDKTPQLKLDVIGNHRYSSLTIMPFKRLILLYNMKFFKNFQNLIIFNLTSARKFPVQEPIKRLSGDYQIRKIADYST